MSLDRFVKPEVVRLALSRGDYIDVKKRLSHGEREDFFATIAPYDLSGVPKFDRHVLRTARLMTYLVGWSLTNNGTPVPMSPDLPEALRTATIRSLDTDTFDEIHAAILNHENEMDAQREMEKNGQGGESAAPATSPSPSDVIGDTSGSVN